MSNRRRCRDNDRRAYIERDIARDGRMFDRIAFIDPVDARDLPAVLAALESDSRDDPAPPRA
jgi:hypothetical protein